MFVPEKEHECHRVVELVHLLEVGNLIQIANIEHGKILDTVGDPYAALVTRRYTGGGLSRIL